MTDSEGSESDNHVAPFVYACLNHASMMRRSSLYESEIFELGTELERSVCIVLQHTCRNYEHLWICSINLSCHINFTSVRSHSISRKWRTGVSAKDPVIPCHTFLDWTSDDSSLFFLRNLCRSQGFPSRRCWKRMRTNWWTPRPVTRTAVYGGPQWFGFRTWTAPKHDSNQMWVDLEATFFSLSIWWNYCCICMTKMPAVFDGWMTCWDPFLEAELKPIRVRFLQARRGCFFFFNGQNRLNNSMALRHF